MNMKRIHKYLIALIAVLLMTNQEVLALSIETPAPDDGSSNTLLIGVVALAMIAMFIMLGKTILSLSELINRDKPE